VQADLNVTFLTESNHRWFFDEYAREKEFDPQVPENWYLVSQEVRDNQSRKDIINEHGGFINALLKLYPEVPFDVSKFKRTAAHYWDNSENRRKFLDAFAASQGFDPLVPEKWYDVSYKDLTEVKGGWQVIKHHGTYVKAITELYPEVPFNKKLFQPKQIMATSSEHRQFFEEFAREKGINQLNPSHWYSITKKEVESRKGGKKVIVMHNGSYINALVDVFPEITFDKGMFYKKSAKNAIQ